MASFLKLIRFQNLLIIVITLYLIRFCVVHPLIKSLGLMPQMNEFHFLLLSLSTIFIAAAGYAINDYFDVKIDRINKPEKMVVDITIKRRIAILTHLIFNALAFIMAFILCLEIKIYSLIILHLLTAILLLIYSVKYKREFITGNIIIAFLVGLIPVLASYYEVNSTQISFSDLIQNRYFFFLMGYCVFAFLTTLSREIIKDIEDFDGDIAYGCNTMPIKLGIKKTKSFVLFISSLILLILSAMQYNEYKSENHIASVYLLLFITLPLIFIVYKLYHSESKSDISFISKLFKTLMIFGVLSTAVIYFFTNISY